MSRADIRASLGWELTAPFLLNEKDLSLASEASYEIERSERKRHSRMIARRISTQFTYDTNRRRTPGYHSYVVRRRATRKHLSTGKNSPFPTYKSRLFELTFSMVLVQLCYLWLQHQHPMWAWLFAKVVACFLQHHQSKRRLRQRKMHDDSKALTT